MRRAKTARQPTLTDDVVHGVDGRPVASVSAVDRALCLFDGTPAAWVSRVGDIHVSEQIPWMARGRFDLGSWRELRDVFS